MAIFLNFDLKERDLFHDWTILVLKLDISVDQRKPEVRGISVEPLRSYFEQLPVADGKLLLNVAVSDHDGFEDLYFVRPELVEAPSCLKMDENGPRARDFLDILVEFCHSRIAIDGGIFQGHGAYGGWKSLEMSLVSDGLKLPGPPGVREPVPTSQAHRAGLAELLAWLDERSIFHQATAKRWPWPGECHDKVESTLGHL